MSKWILLLSICVASLGTTVVEAGAPLRIGDRRQVFIDGRLIEESRCKMERYRHLLFGAATLLKGKH